MITFHQKALSWWRERGWRERELPVPDDLPHQGGTALCGVNSSYTSLLPALSTWCTAHISRDFKKGLRELS